jgi:hypothetical protein
MIQQGIDQERAIADHPKLDFGKETVYYRRS